MIYDRFHQDTVLNTNQSVNLSRYTCTFTRSFLFANRFLVMSDLYDVENPMSFHENDSKTLSTTKQMFIL